jgi:hypothetical protein
MCNARPCCIAHLRAAVASRSRPGIVTMLYVFASQDALTEGAGVRFNRRPVLACTGPRKRRRRLVAGYRFRWQRPYHGALFPQIINICDARTRHKPETGQAVDVIPVRRSLIVNGTRGESAPQERTRRCGLARSRTPFL